MTNSDERMLRLMDLLGIEKAAVKNGRGEALDHVLRVLRDGLDITDFEALELLDNLREVMARQPEEEPEPTEEPMPLATKGKRAEGTRDARGYQKNDVLGLGIKQREAPVRDPRGYVKNKHADPNRYGR